MVEWKKGQMSFGDLGMELVTDLGTGEQTLRRRRTKRSAGGQMKAPAPTRQWWEERGLGAFYNAAEGWRQSQSARIAEWFGHDVEVGGPQMSAAETEESLKRAFRVAQRSRITALDVAGLIRGESLNIEERLGTGANWLPGYVDATINWLAEVYRLNSVTAESLKRFAHRRRLPQFN